MERAEQMKKCERLVRLSVAVVEIAQTLSEEALALRATLDATGPASTAESPSDLPDDDAAPATLAPHLKGVARP